MSAAAVCIVQIIYTHRVKHFQEDSEGNPSALLLPALLDTKVRSAHQYPLPAFPAVWVGWVDA